MMTTSSGRNRRRRGRRGQRPRQDEQQQEHPTTLEAPEPQAASLERREVPQQESPERGPRRAEGEQGRGDRPGGARKRGRGKRRSTKRPTIGAMPSEVLKEEVRDVRPSGEVYLRKVEDLETPEGLNFGCPMLTRTRLPMPFAGGVHMPRCSMGWALHNEVEASFCMRTPDLLDCWKEHPDREAALRASSETENAAD